MSNKDRFNSILKNMDRCLKNIRSLYNSIDDSNFLLEYYKDILEYEVLVKEYKNFNRDTLNKLIMDRVEDDYEELKEMCKDFIQELNSEYSEELEEEEEDNSSIESFDEYEDFNFEEEELEEDDFYYEDLD